MKAQTLTIIGLGRVGLSTAMAIKASSAGLEIVGHDRLRDLTAKAKDELGAIDRAEWNLINAAEAADILVLSLPLVELEETLPHIVDVVRPHALVLDYASLKGPGLRWAEQRLKAGHYVGVMPLLAGKYLSDGRDDLAAASADLFQNSVFCLMPSVSAAPQAVETAVAFGRLLGATPYFVDAMEYDSLVQGVQTMPGLLAAAMFGAVRKSAGWRDMLRFANSPFAVATQPLEQGPDISRLALNDKAATLRWLDAVLEELQTVRRMVQEGDRESTDAIIHDLQAQREKWLQDRVRNDWVEAPASDFDRPSLSEAFLGGWISRGKRKDDEQGS